MTLTVLKPKIKQSVALFEPHDAFVVLSVFSQFWIVPSYQEQQEQQEQDGQARKKEGKDEAKKLLNARPRY